MRDLSNQEKMEVQKLTKLSSVCVSMCVCLSILSLCCYFINRMRDLSNQEKMEVQKLTKLNEKFSTEVMNLKKDKERYSSEADQLAKQMIDLKEQV